MTWPLAEGASLGCEGNVIARRYRLKRVLGSGSFGVVWSADDTVTGWTVAVKLLYAQVDLDLSRAQLEVLALRQGLPGVVELLDEGSDEGQAFLVMELVDGRPFPGRDPPCAWGDIADVVVALLSTLSRVHAAFVVHCDLKPANVLVTRDGQVKLLDFGIARPPNEAAFDSQDSSDLVGTPMYMAPEQLCGGALTDRTDIYALGVMLYEALSGRLPHEGATPGQLLYARMNMSPVPLSQAAPGVPPNVARLVDRMIALDSSERPASALDVLAVLRGDNAVEEPLFPWLGSQAALMTVIKAAEEGRSLDVVGPKGHGRTRLLLGARQVLSSARAVHWIEPTERGEPLACLLPLTGPLDPAGDPEGAARTAGERVRAAALRGDVLLVDDLERLDSWSIRILDSVRSEGAVIRALLAPQEGAAAVTLKPLGEIDLRSLFAGPDRLLHLREDAARLLHQRTSGVPAEVVREVSEWLSLGIARWTRSLLVVSRSALHRLSAVPEARGRAEHAAIARALPPGTAGRLHHLLLAEARDDAARLAVAREAAALATRLLGEGRIGEAVPSIESGIRAVRGLGPAAAAETWDLLGLWAEAALEEGTPHAVNRLLHALYRAKPHPRKAVVESLALAMKVEEFGSDRAMSLAETIPPQADARLERLRVRVLMHAAHLRANDAAEEALLDALSAGPVARDEEIAARIEHARGRLRYRQGRYLESAALHESAAARSTSVLHRTEAMTAAAWALIEAFELDRAEAIANDARTLAAEHRHAIHETYATWSLRAVAYRKRRAGGPDMELVQALQYAVGRRVQGAILITEAAAAWQSGHPEAMKLAETCFLLLSALDERRGTLLMRCLMIAQDCAASPGEITALHERAFDVTGAGIGIQALGLLALGGRLLCQMISGERLASLADQIPRRSWDTPVDVLSVSEALEAIRKACPDQGSVC